MKYKNIVERFGGQWLNKNKLNVFLYLGEQKEPMTAFEIAEDPRFANIEETNRYRNVSYHASKLNEEGLIKAEGPLCETDKPVPLNLSKKAGYDKPIAGISYILSEDGKKLYEEILPLKDELLA